VRRRHHAEQLAAENAKLYADQRTLAQTLQSNLLPDKLPDVADMEFGVRYIAGVEGVDIGGDWYDVIALDERRVLFVVGDVSGRGLRAATIMASLRFAVRAYTAQGDLPAMLLSKLSRLLDVDRDGHFATVLCGIVDLKCHELTIANAGHPNPLLISRDRATFITAEIGVPVGINGTPAYDALTVPLPAAGTILAFTDGLVERRGEEPEVGLERLRVAVSQEDEPLDDLLTRVVDQMATETGDDTAMLGVRWNT
jgi:serine phosphatase RsbU (regulator of sigma subunit)